MPTVSLTTFVDFVAATGTSRITKVRDAKNSYDQGYAPERDFYKLFRDRAERTLSNGWSALDFKKALKDVTDHKKVANYEACRAGLTKWVGRKTITARPALRDVWESGGLQVSLNPELHAEVNGTPHLIKLYFKAEPLSKQRADVILRTLGKIAPADTTVGVLDVRRSKLFIPTVDILGLDALLDAEAVALVSLWDAI